MLRFSSHRVEGDEGHFGVDPVLLEVDDGVSHAIVIEVPGEHRLQREDDFTRQVTQRRSGGAKPTGRLLEDAQRILEGQHPRNGHSSAVFQNEPQISDQGGRVVGLSRYLEMKLQGQACGLGGSVAHGVGRVVGAFTRHSHPGRRGGRSPTWLRRRTGQPPGDPVASPPQPWT